MLRCAAALLAVLAAGALLAQTMPSRHGAFALDAGSGAWGWALGYAKPTGAADAALRSCRSRRGARGCAVLFRFEDTCAAFAADARGDAEAFGSAWGFGVAAVREQALNNCRVRGGGRSECLTRVWGCSTPDAMPTAKSGSVWDVPVASLQPGGRFRECVECPEMVVLPAASFPMGSPPQEEGRYADEGPPRTVTIAAFAAGVFEVTFTQWDACMAAGGCAGQPPADAGWGRGQRPVINVTRADAETYLAWLTKETGGGYRLPSEAEWEFLARAGTTTPFHTGPTIVPSLANYDGGAAAYGDGVGGAFRQRTLPVGAFRANAFGLHDVHGNVWEWVADCWNDSYANAPADGGAWRAGNCDVRVQRGGSWSNAPKDTRAAVRNWRPAGYRDANSGFRAVREIKP